MTAPDEGEQRGQQEVAEQGHAKYLRRGVAEHRHRLRRGVDGHQHQNGQQAVEIGQADDAPGEIGIRRILACEGLGR